MTRFGEAIVEHTTGLCHLAIHTQEFKPADVNTPVTRLLCIFWRGLYQA